MQQRSQQAQTTNAQSRKKIGSGQPKEGDRERHTGCFATLVCLHYNWGILPRNPGQSHIPERL